MKPLIYWNDHVLIEVRPSANGVATIYVARRQIRSLWALMAEAFNDVRRKHGKSQIEE